ncbi:tyrosine-type recombinase/integrase, partial [Sphingomonas fennica]
NSPTGAATYRPSKLTPTGLRNRRATLVLASSGCRISEALALTLDHIDAVAGCVVIESLKKRRRGIYRAVPLPPALIRTLLRVHGGSAPTNARLWPWSRMTAWRKVTEVMDLAGVRGLQASPKGFRHGFGVSAVQAGVPLNMVQKWLGHADMRTTALYAAAIGREEMQIAERLWRATAAIAIPRGSGAHPREAEALARPSAEA